MDLSFLVFLAIVGGMVWYIRDYKKTGNANPLNPGTGHLPPSVPPVPPKFKNPK